MSRCVYRPMVMMLAALFLAAPAVRAQEVANVDQLKADAFRALRAGKFDVTSELLGKAAAGSTDPKLVQMAKWTAAFETQRQTFLAERRKEYDKAADNVHKLLKAKKPEYAMDYLSRAYLLSEDKKAFRAEKWVDTLVNDAIELAKTHESHEQWLKVLRLYSGLGSVEPSNPLWKEKLKTATRRLRLLGMYNQDQFKKVQESETTDREAADQIVKPTTQPVTKPAPAEEKDDSFRTDWKQSLKDIRLAMLSEALKDAREYYFRQVSYRDLGVGGLTSLHLLLTTRGIEAAFPAMKDKAKREELLATVDAWNAKLKAAAAADEETILKDAIAAITNKNNDSLKLPEEVIVNEFADGAFAELDPFSTMIWPSEVEEFNKNIDAEFSGVGIQIQSDDDGSLKVVSPLEDSPGYRAGIKAGDIITRINGKNAKGISINQAVKNITGKSGTKVVLTIRSQDGTVRELEIIRQTIKVASVKGWKQRAGGGWEYFVDPENKIGYIRLTGFTKITSDELDRAMEDMQAHGLRGLIMDLRYNPGGMLRAATEVCDKFMSEGVIVSTKPDREMANPPREIFSAKKEAGEMTDLPLVVLVNQYSASASEIVSGAFKDHKRALILGERTFGKGSVQMLFPVSRERTFAGKPNAFLKLTTSHYYLPSDKCIHREENSTDWGVSPDITIDMTPEQMRAAIDARQDSEVLRDKDKPEGEKKEPKVNANGKPKGDPLTQDPQLSAGLLMLRLQLSGAKI